MRTPAALALLLCAAPAAAQETRMLAGAGYAWFARDVDGARREAGGVAIELRVDRRLSPRLSLDATLTWGLTDWDRAGEWIDAGNRAGSWTTDRFADVEAWVRRGEDDGTLLPRLFGALFADLFLVASYVAVPVCYVGSLGGATSHLQADVTAVVHLAGGADGLFVELGAGAAALPETGVGFRNAVGPIAGIGARVGPLRIGGRVLWSPPSLNAASGGGTVLTGAITATWAR